MNLGRRDFISDTALLMGGLASGLVSNASKISAQEIPGAESWNNEESIRKKDDKLLNIGGIFGLWSHTSATWWRYLNPPEGNARATGMRVSHLWCVDREAGEKLAKRYDAELVENYDDMTGSVDGMLIDDFFATPFMPDMSLPYLDAKIPCFFDRPMASSMAGAMKVINTSKRTGTPFMVSSAYEYLKEVEVSRLRQKDIGDIVAYEARSSASNVYMYVLHGLWFTLKTMGVDVERICHRTKDPVAAPGITFLEHSRNDRTFYGSIHHPSLKNIMCSVRAYGNKGDCEVTCASDGRPWYRDIYTYLEMLHTFERMIRTNEYPEPIEYTEAKMRIFISLLHSVYEKDGGFVEIASLPENWDAGIPKGFSRSYPDEIIDRYRKIFR
ncbi:hypothetical protein ACFL2X_00310 [Candidatus Latescibacterota bacterium]